MVDILHTLDRLFQAHAPETLMALFGAATTLLLFRLVWLVLRHLFGLQVRAADQEADQEQTSAILVESLVSALVTEAGHLRRSMDGILGELLRSGQARSETLTALAGQVEQTPDEIVRLLKPEFDSLHRELRQAEQRIIAKVTDTPHGHDGDERKNAGESVSELPPGISEVVSDASHRTLE